MPPTDRRRARPLRYPRHRHRGLAPSCNGAFTTHVDADYGRHRRVGKRRRRHHRLDGRHQPPHARTPRYVQHRHRGRRRRRDSLRLRPRRARDQSMPPENVVDAVGRYADRLVRTPDGWRIGSARSWTDALQSHRPLPRERDPGDLRSALRPVGRGGGRLRGGRRLARPAAGRARRDVVLVARRADVLVEVAATVVVREQDAGARPERDRRRSGAGRRDCRPRRRPPRLQRRRRSLHGASPVDQPVEAWQAMLARNCTTVLGAAHHFGGRWSPGVGRHRHRHVGRGVGRWRSPRHVRRHEGVRPAARRVPAGLARPARRRRARHGARCHRHARAPSPRRRPRPRPARRRRRRRPSPAH